MFFEKKKNIFSEVSDTNKNINSDYYNVFQNEFKKLFQSQNNDELIMNDKNIPIENDHIKNLNVEDNISNNFKSVSINDNDIFFINLFSKYLTPIYKKNI